MARTKKKIVAKEPVKLWFKPLPSGNKSIYLFIRQGSKKEYERLDLILVPEIDRISKYKNDQMLQLAKKIQAERHLTISAEEHGFKNTSSKSKVNAIQYIDMLANESLKRTGNKRSYYHTLLSLNRHLIEYAGTDTVPFKIVNEAFVKGFISYLRTAKSFNKPKNAPPPMLAQNTRHKLYEKLKFVINRAVKDSIIKANPCLNIDTSDKPKAEESKREYLTINELKTLTNTNCSNDNLKRAFIFCCLTGIRYGDIKKIKWGDLHTDNKGNTELQFKQQKTKGQMYLQISEQALKWLPDRNNANDNDVIFTIPKNDYANKVIGRWVKEAGINKKITFHCSRHTAATMLLTLGVSLEVTGKLLGHGKISTTAIYGKIVNEARRAAVDKQNGILD